MASRFSRCIRAGLGGTRWRVGLVCRSRFGWRIGMGALLTVSALSFLSFAGVKDHTFEFLCTVDAPFTATLAPEILAAQAGSFQFACAPCLQLTADYLRIASFRGHDDMNVIGPRISDVQMPTTDSTMRFDG